MKIKLISHQTTAIMRQFKFALTVFAAAAGLISAQAQYITGGQYLQNATTSGGYGGWASAAYNYTSTGIEVQSSDNSDYGGAYFVINSGVQTLSSLDTELILTFTLNGNAASYNYFSPGQLVLNDANTPSSGPWYFNMPYFGYEYNPNNANVTWNGSGTTYTVTMNIATQDPGLLTNIQTGNDQIYSFSLDLDPTGQIPSPWDITFNSIELAPAPEPASLALLGLGAAGLLVVRRRK
jgi:PEP-CTERM motif